MKLFIEFGNKLADSYIQNSYINKESCISSANTIKKNISNILNNSPTYATEYEKKWFTPQYLDTIKTYDVIQNVKRE